MVLSERCDEILLMIDEALASCAAPPAHLLRPGPAEDGARQAARLANICGPGRR